MLPIIGAGLAYVFYKTDQACKIDERTRKRYAQAYSKQEEARELLEKQKYAANQALIKVVNRKRGILMSSMKDFLEVYEKILKINFIEGDGIKELSSKTIIPEEMSIIRTFSQNAVKPMNDKEILWSLFKGGIGGCMVKDSERNLSMANAQMKLANVAYAEAEAISVSLDVIIDKSNRIAEMLMNLNLFFVKGINHTSNIIEKNGYSRLNYSQDDRKALMSCINIADAIKKIIDAPMFDKNGELAIETAKVIEIGNNLIGQLEKNC